MGWHLKKDAGTLIVVSGILRRHISSLDRFIQGKVNLVAWVMKFATVIRHLYPIQLICFAVRYYRLVPSW
jgi:hypothetical protein